MENKSAKSVGAGFNTRPDVGARRIGIFGGSFNPVHIGHIAIAKAVRDSGLVDEVWLMVSPRNPLKQQSGLMDDRERLARAQKAVEHLDNIKACDFEFALPRPSYTYITMEKLEQQFPNYSFSLLIGADNWAHFSLWRNHDQLLRRYPIIIYPRQGYPIDPDTLPPSVACVDMPLLNVSSTRIRQMLSRGEDVSPLLPD